MVKKFRIFQIILVIITQQLVAYSQGEVGSEGKQKLSSKIYMSYILGIQAYNDNVLYNPGYSVLFTQSYKLSGNVDIGIGSGYISLVNERFAPFYFEVFGYKKKRSNSPIIKFQFGYSAAWYNKIGYLSGYDLSGGIYFTAGMGRQLRLKNRYSILFHWSYCHQSAKINHQIFGNRDYSDMINYDMLQFSIGLIRANY